MLLMMFVGCSLSFVVCFSLCAACVLFGVCCLLGDAWRLLFCIVC